MNRSQGILRLRHLREQNEAVGARMDQERGRFAALADPSSAPRVVSAFNLFQTPPDVAALMASYLVPHLEPGATVLEPSAGLGRLYRAVRDAGHAGPMVLVDESAECCLELYGMIEGDNARLYCRDFLAMDCGPVDGVVMNPPFKRGRDIKHILHALDLVHPGGRVVTLCANGPRQRSAIMGRAEHWEDLPADTFRAEGTRVAAALAVLVA